LKEIYSVTAKVTDPRKYKTIRFSPELEAEIVKAADERNISFNLFVLKACEFYLSKLIPIDEIKLTKD
jgi:predicted HicB family RNase H-like nuclease